VIPGPAAAAALLNPRRVAVIGDTPTSGRGGLLHEQLVRRGFTGEIIPVNPKYAEIRGLRAYPTVADYGAPVDFVAVTLGPARALASMRDCVEAGARAVLFIGSGFAEVGGEGAQIQARLRGLALDNGIALAGPNCYGLANVRAGFAPFFGALPEPLTPGPIALISGSGALTHAVGDVLAARGTGFGYVITVGNEAGVDAADYLSLLAEDPAIRVIACYLEALRDAPRFAAAVRKAAAAGQRVVALTVGRSEASRRASAAHTGALAGEARVLTAFLADLGVVLVRDLDELAEAVELAAFVPAIGAGTISVSTISGGGCAVLADLAADVGLPLAPFTEPARAALSRAIPGGGAVGNPLDLTGLATDDESIISAALRAADGQAGAGTGLHLFAVNTPLAATETDRDLYRRMAATVVRTAPELRSPVALFTLTSGALDPVLVDCAHRAGIALMQGSREALNAVARLRDATARGPARTEPPAVTAQARAALEVLGRTTDATLTQSSAAEVLEAAGLTTARGRLVRAAELAGAFDAAVAVADRLGYPVVAKIESPDILHKSDVGGVILDLTSSAAVRTAVGALLERAGALGARIDGVRIETQVPDGVAMLIGVVVDPRIGPAVVLGAGGVYVELLDDVALLLAPATAEQVREALTGLRVNRLLTGLRGQPTGDIDALVDAVVAVSELAWAARGELAALDVNPVLVHPVGVTAVDAVILRRTEPASAPEPPPLPEGTPR
jgi:acetate---CoA ligase (ADP-forming)